MDTAGFLCSLVTKTNFLKKVIRCHIVGRGQSSHRTTLETLQCSQKIFRAQANIHVRKIIFPQVSSAIYSSVDLACAVAKLEVMLVVLGTSKHFSKKIIFYCFTYSPKILKMIHGTLASSIKCEILSNPVMLL